VIYINQLTGDGVGVQIIQTATVEHVCEADSLSTSSTDGSLYQHPGNILIRRYPPSTHWGEAITRALKRSLLLWFQKNDNFQVGPHG